jgi:hypothetical protein
MDSSDVSLTILIILIFVGLYFINILAVGIKHIKDNWPLYRCNPIMIPFASMFGKEVGTNFTFCIQNMQSTFMTDLMKPIHYAMSLIGDIGSDTTSAIQEVRNFFNKIRTYITSIIQSIMGVFLNILIQFQKITMNIKDLISKILGILATVLFILSGAMMTMEATWAGPPGALIKGVGAICFHPDTLVKKYNGKIVKMKNIKHGDKLKNGQTVYATMKIHNLDENKNNIDTLYSIQNGEKNKPIFVTGSHLIFDKSINNFIQVKDYHNSIKCSTNSNTLVCLITSDHTIPLGNYIFHDWDDNNEIGIPPST